MIQIIIAKLTSYLMILGYPGIFIAMALEGLSIPFPGSVIILFAGFLVSRDVMNYWIVIMIASFGYTLGSLFPYYLCYTGRSSVLKSLGKFFPLTPRKFIVAQRWLNKYGPGMVCFSRPFFIGNYLSYLAGMSKMKFFIYFIYTIIGAVIWNIGLVTAGNFLGRNWKFALEIISKYSYVAVSIFIVSVLFLIFKKKIIFYLKNIFLYQ
jgi:membrane protein DedA with SNARE-associated domain